MRQLHPVLTVVGGKVVHNTGAVGALPVTA